MSWSDRRAVLGLAAGCLLASCGFRPLHGGGAPSLEGRVRVDDIPGRAGRQLARTLRQRLGEPGGTPEFALGVEVGTSTRAVVFGEQSEVLRYVLKVEAEYELRRSSTGEVVASNSIEVSTSVNTTESPYAAFASERDRTIIAATEAAERILRDIHLRLALLDGEEAA